jgi:asparagine synthase (glutamine-hydrolysing)
MGGIVGFAEARANLEAGELRARVGAMADRLRHRGPDAGGTWVDAATGLALGHCRLSILDLSEQGAQPMRSSCGRVVLAYNGEIYNHPELRRELRDLGRPFRGSSDTEVLVEALATWGTEASLPRLLGMFAFAAWDTHRHRLILASDPIGQKPLYCGWVGRRFVFASELKALQALPGLGLTVDPDVVALFLRFAFVPPRYCIFKNLRRLEPGTAIEVDPDAVGGAPRRMSFWSMAGAAVRGERTPFEGTAEDAVDAVEALLSDAVRGRMVADVPFGALLSGGIASSAVVALMQRSSTRPVHPSGRGLSMSSCSWWLLRARSASRAP